MAEEPLFDDPTELVDDLLNEGVDDVMDDDVMATGQTSDEAFEDSDEPDNSKKLAFNVYDAMMLVSLILITLAVFFVVMEGREFGNFPFEKTRIDR